MENSKEEIQSHYPQFGIAVDGYCLGNPGQGGYQGICLQTKKILFKRNYMHITNNLAEFLGVCHALGYAKKNDLSVVYSDSNTALTWARSRKPSTGINPIKGKDALEDMKKCLMWLDEQKRIPLLLKWETKLWGEIPADFGNKK